MEGGASGVKQQCLLDEITKNYELAKALNCRLLDRFLKQKEEDKKADQGVPPNPIDYGILVSRETQLLLKSCHELLETEIINKLEGK